MARTRDGRLPRSAGTVYEGGYGDDVGAVTAPATDAARQWEGWGTAAKPAHEPIVLARKPLAEGTVAANVLAWGTGALNIDACRESDVGRPANEQRKKSAISFGIWHCKQRAADFERQRRPLAQQFNSRRQRRGRGGVRGVRGEAERGGAKRSSGTQGTGVAHGSGDWTGTGQATPAAASRFFYTAKASKADRDEGLEGMPSVASERQ